MQLELRPIPATALWFSLTLFTFLCAALGSQEWVTYDANQTYTNIGLIKACTSNGCANLTSNQTTHILKKYLRAGACAFTFLFLALLSHAAGLVGGLAATFSAQHHVRGGWVVVATGVFSWATAFLGLVLYAGVLGGPPKKASYGAGFAITIAYTVLSLIPVGISVLELLRITPFSNVVLCTAQLVLPSYIHSTGGPPGNPRPLHPHPSSPSPSPSSSSSPSQSRPSSQPLGRDVDAYVPPELPTTIDIAPPPAYAATIDLGIPATSQTPPSHPGNNGNNPHAGGEVDNNDDDDDDDLVVSPSRSEEAPPAASMEAAAAAPLDL